MQPCGETAPCSKAEGGKCDGSEEKRRRFRTGGSKASSTGIEGLGRVQSRLFGGLQSGLLRASQLLLVLLSGGVGLGLVFGVEACLRGLEVGLGLVERGLGGPDVLVGLRLRVLRGLFRLLSLLQGFSVLSSLLLFGFKILLRRTQMILRIRYTLCRFIYLALRRAPLRGLGGLGYRLRALFIGSSGRFIGQCRGNDGSSCGNSGNSYREPFAFAFLCTHMLSPTSPHGDFLWHRWRGSPPSQRPLGFEGMDGVNRLSNDSSSFHHCMRLWGYTGNLQKRMDFMSFSQHTCPLYEQSRRSGLLIIGMGTLMEGDISQ